MRRNYSPAPFVTNSAPPYTDFLAPRYWPTWLGIGLLCLAALTPFQGRMALGSLLGRLTWHLARERRYITAVNIGICFGELSLEAQQALVKQAFIENGIGLVETACGWIRSPAQFIPLCQMQGKEQFQAALDRGRGIVLYGGHYSTLDFSANLLSQYFPFAVTYRGHSNPLFDAFMLRGRQRNCNAVFDRKDVRGALRHLKDGKILWYAPDQDYGPEQSVYAPFFGRAAATITAGSRYATFNKSPVFIVRHYRDTAAKRYILHVFEVPNFPSDDAVQDATRMNALIESNIRMAPAQYLWMHKRFKTNPGGKPESPYIHIKTPNRQLNQVHYAQLIAQAQPVNGHPERLQLPSGLQLRQWPGLAKGYWQRQHPALQLDRLSKHLRANAISTITVDSLFRFGTNTGATCFVPQGTQVSCLPAGEVPELLAATLLVKLHQCGCWFRHLQADNLLLSPTALAIDNPLALSQRPGSTAYAERLTDLQTMATVAGYDARQTQEFRCLYLEQLKPGIRAALRPLLAQSGSTPDNAGKPNTESSPT